MTPEFREQLNASYIMAHQQHHEYLTTEMLLSVLLMHEPSAVLQVFQDWSVDVAGILKGLRTYFDNMPKVSGKSVHDLEPTKGLHRVLERAQKYSRGHSHSDLHGLHVVLAIMDEPDSYARYILEYYEFPTDVLRLRLAIRHFSERQRGFLDMEAEPQITSKPRPKANKKALAQYCSHLNKRAKKGKIDELIGRDDELERMMQILCRRRKNNPLLVGESGVGKTAIAEGLAWRIVHEQVPRALLDTQIYALDLGALLAGTKYRGEFEKRLKQVLAELAEIPDAVVFIDEIHTIIGAGATTGGAVDASNLLKPALANGQLCCIGSTTYQEYRTIFEKDRALARRFLKLEVCEPSVSACIDIVRGVIKKYQQFHEVTYHDSAIVAAVELSAKYVHERFLPDKAFDVIDEAGAACYLSTRRRKTINVADIEAIVAKMARIPAKQLSRSDVQQLEKIDQNIKRVVFGQDDAIASITKVMRLSRSGLTAANKPIGSLLFAGPTGVGKTEVARQLALHLGIRLLRFDMSEYMEKHSVARLIGAPPGYVGYDEGGLLTEAVNKNPHAVLLLDELEKAHPDIFNILLQVMDNARLTDNNGREVNFGQVVLIMTTNSGANLQSRASMGFTVQDHASDAMQSIKQLFSPEFRNRLDDIIQFKPLGTDSIAHVVNKLIGELAQLLAAKNVTIRLSKSAQNYLCEKGYDKLMGARPMARLIQDQIKTPIADELLFGALKNGGHVQVDCRQNALKLSYRQALRAPKSKPVALAVGDE